MRIRHFTVYQSENVENKLKNLEARLSTEQFGFAVDELEKLQIELDKYFGNDSTEIPNEVVVGSIIDMTMISTFLISYIWNLPQLPTSVIRQQFRQRIYKILVLVYPQRQILSNSSLHILP